MKWRWSSLKNVKNIPFSYCLITSISFYSYFWLFIWHQVLPTQFLDFFVFRSIVVCGSSSSLTHQVIVDFNDDRFRHDVINSPIVDKGEKDGDEKCNCCVFQNSSDLLKKKVVCYVNHFVNVLLIITYSSSNNS